ncbi:hypothetical protein LBMAG51_11870 [Phycisphaerae bacterium]|nr:hypothetical protein LBMAG51_11870 [Phycisphaerae bacterium]
MEYHADKLCISIAVSERGATGKPIAGAAECAGEVEVVVGWSMFVLEKGMVFMTAAVSGVFGG